MPERAAAEEDIASYFFSPEKIEYEIARLPILEDQFYISLPDKYIWIDKIPTDARCGADFCAPKEEGKKKNGKRRERKETARKAGKKIVNCPTASWEHGRGETGG